MNFQEREFTSPQSAAYPKFDMDWQYCSPISVIQMIFDLPWLRVEKGGGVSAPCAYTRLTRPSKEGNPVNVLRESLFSPVSKSQTAATRQSTL